MVSKVVRSELNPYIRSEVREFEAGYKVAMTEHIVHFEIGSHFR